MKKILIGIGNEYCGNDAIGILIARHLKEFLPDWDIKTGAFSGIDFLEAIDGYNEVIVIDSLYKPDVPSGNVVEINLADFAGLGGFSYIHSLNLASAIELGRQLQINLPEKIKIFGITIEKKGEIGEKPNSVLLEKLNTITNSILKSL